jgi:hypothetical protein
MKYLLALALSLLASSTYAQTWQCFSGATACAPGSPNCTCTQAVQPPPPPVQPQCPVMTYWNGVTCAVPAPAYNPYPPTFIPPYYNPYQGYGGWQHHDDHDHPH